MLIYVCFRHINVCACANAKPTQTSALICGPNACNVQQHIEHEAEAIEANAKKFARNKLPILTFACIFYEPNSRWPREYKTHDIQNSLCIISSSSTSFMSLISFRQAFIVITTYHVWYIFRIMLLLCNSCRPISRKTIAKTRSWWAYRQKTHQNFGAARSHFAQANLNEPSTRL